MKKPTTLELFGEFFRHGSNAVILVLLASLLASIWKTGQLGAALPWMVLGLLIFFLTEYAAHRFQLHAPPLENAVAKSIQHRLHYDHHTEPNRLDLLFIPVWYLLPTLVLYGFLYFKLRGVSPIRYSITYSAPTNLNPRPSGVRRHGRST